MLNCQWVNFLFWFTDPNYKETYPFVFWKKLYWQELFVGKKIRQQKLSSLYKNFVTPWYPLFIYITPLTSDSSTNNGIYYVFVLYTHVCMRVLVGKQNDQCHLDAFQELLVALLYILLATIVENVRFYWHTRS